MSFKSEAVRFTTVPFCIATAACNALFSLDSRRTTLITSYIVTDGVTSEVVSFKGVIKCLAFGWTEFMHEKALCYTNIHLRSKPQFM